MKKILLCLVSVVSLTGFSQTTIQLKNTATSATVAANATITAATTASNQTDVVIDVKNTSSSAQSYQVKRYDTHLNIAGTTTAVAQFCFASYCYGPDPSVSPNPITLNPGQSASQLSGSYNMLVTELIEADGGMGFNEIKYTVQSISNAADSIQFTIRYNEAMGVNEAQKTITSVDLFPNPATENVSVKVNALKATDGRIVVYNALGAIVAEKAVALNEGKNKVEMNVDTFAPGIYFATIKSGNSNITRKFIVK
jgi:hypothetical protein